MSARLAAPLVLALSAAGLLRDVSVHLWKEGQPPRTFRIGTRYEPLSALLEQVPRDARLGYLGGGEDMKTYYDALYALAPRIVLRGVSRWTVADFATPREVDEIARAQALRVVARFDNGTALLERVP